MIAIYTKSESGQLSRDVVTMGKQMHIDNYADALISSTEKITGWPESVIEWHGNIGYGVK
jgi:hypothetical protein